MQSLLAVSQVYAHWASASKGVRESRCYAFWSHNIAATCILQFAQDGLVIMLEYLARNLRGLNVALLPHEDR